MRPSDDLIVSATEPTGANRKKVWMQKGKNLIKNWYKGGFYNFANNTLEKKGSTEFSCTDFIEIQVNKQYIFSNSENMIYGWIVLFDKNLNFLEEVHRDRLLEPFTISNPNAKYIIFNLFNRDFPNLSWVQLEQGSTATEHESYIEPKIYVKNGNDVYEEFISKEKLDNYSTQEQLIGKWHNGADVYRKTLLIDLSNFNGEQEHFINYSDYGINRNIVVNNYKGLCARLDDVWQVLPCTLEGWHIDIYDFRETQFTIKISQNQKNLGLTILTLVLEYEYKNW